MIPSKWFRASIFVFIIAALSGCGGKPDAKGHPSGSGPGKDPLAKTPDSSPTGSTVLFTKVGSAINPDFGDFRLTPKTWLEEWDKDEDAAQKRYSGKKIELTGMVESVSADPYGTVGFVYLKVEGKKATVRCGTVDKEPWLKVGPGSMVKILGIPETTLKGALGQCRVLQASPHTAFPISAQQLASDFASDSKAAAEKYRDEWLLVEGEVAGKDKLEKKSAVVNIFLKTDGQIKVMTFMNDMSDFEKKRVESLDVGQKIKVLGRATLSPLRENVVMIKDEAVSILP